MDPWHILGVPNTASKEEIKAAFRKHALRHHPDQHVNSPEAVRKQAESTFKSIKAAYEKIEEGKYREANAYNRSAGYRRHNGTTYAEQHAYSSNYYAGGAGYGRYNRAGFAERAAAEARTFYRAFTSSGSAALSAGLAGVFIAGIMFLEPIFSSAWERRNEGKLFKAVEHDVLQRNREELVALKAEREARALEEDQRRRVEEAAAAAAAEVENDCLASVETVVKEIPKSSGALVTEELQQMHGADE